jgi:hypothetical protein
VSHQALSTAARVLAATIAASLPGAPMPEQLPALLQVLQVSTKRSPAEVKMEAPKPKGSENGSTKSQKEVKTKAPQAERK